MLGRLAILGQRLLFSLPLLSPALGQLQGQCLLLVGCPAILGRLRLLSGVSQCRSEALFNLVCALAVEATVPCQAWPSADNNNLHV